MHSSHYKRGDRAEVTPNLKLTGFLTDEFLDMFELRGFCNVEVEYSQMTSCVY